MRTIIFLLLSFFFVSLSFSQYVEKKKEAPKEEIQSVKTDTNQTVQPIIQPQPVFSYKVKTAKFTLKDDYDEEDITSLSLSKKPKKMKDWYPVSQVEAYLYFVKEKNSSIKIEGPGFYVVVRQNQKLGGTNKLTNSKTWGLFAEGGRYKINIAEQNEPSVDINVEQIGGGPSYAFTRNRPGFNAFVANLGVYQEVEKGTSGLYEWKQTDVFLKFSGWVDLSRNRNLWFSRTNFSWFWVKPLSARRSALYDGQTTEAQVWDKESVGCEFQQTLLMFPIFDNFGLHVGLSVGYQHLSAGQQDWYSPAGFIEIHGYEYKIAQIQIGKKIRSGDNSKNGSLDLIRGSVDFYQIYRSIAN